MYKVAVTYDLFRTSSFGLKSVVRNAVWLFRTLEVLTSEISNLSFTLVASKDDGGTFDATMISNQFHIPYTRNGWALLTNINLPIEINTFEEFDLIVGFGLPPSIINLIHKIGKPLIDLEISPIRYGKNLYLYARTTHSKIDNLLHSIAISTDEIVFEKQRLLAKQSFFCVKDIIQKKHSLRFGVLIGQTDVDLAIVEQGNLRSLNDHDILLKIKKQTENLDLLYVCPHPLMNKSIINIDKCLFSLDNAVLCYFSSYRFWGNKNVEWVGALSSSSLKEAESFGKNTSRLINPDRDFSDLLPITFSSWLNVDETFFSEIFWKAILEKTFHVNYRSPSGFLRDLFGFSLGNREEFLPIPDIAEFKLNQVYPFKTGVKYANCLISGWSAIEESGVWSEGYEAVIVFKSASIDLIEVKIRGTIIAPSLIGNCFLVTPFYKIPLQIKDFNSQHSEMFEWIIPLKPQPNSSICILKFFINQPLSPFELKMSEDKRLLGICIKNIIYTKPTQNSDKDF